jgi:multidrug resistance protein, MATE family
MDVLARAAPEGALPLGQHVRRTARLALPVMLARAGILVMTSVDTIMAGRLGGEELGFYAIALAPFVFCLLVGNGLLGGTVILVSQADGAGMVERAGRIWRLALLIALATGGFFALLLGSGERLLLLLGQGPELARGGGRVLGMLALGMPGMLLFGATSFFLEGVSRPRAGMVVMALANVLNAALNHLLMFEPFGLVAGRGAEGAALATSITRWWMALTLGLYAISMQGREAIGVLAPMRGHWRYGPKLIRLGLPLAASYGLETGAFMTIAIFAGWLGAIPLAAYQIAMSVTALIYMLAIGIATATAVRVGNAIGRRDRAGMAAAGWVGTGLGALVMLALMPVIGFLPGPIVAIYTADPAVVPLAVAAMGVVAFVLVVDAVQGILIGALRGTGDVWVPMLLYVVSFWCGTVPLGYVLAFRFGQGVTGLLVAIMVGLVVASLLLLLRFRKVSRRELRPL